jgi:hypothetical protein
MLLALLALALLAAALALPALLDALRSRRARGRRRRRRPKREALRDPGRERRAEQRARELLRSCINDGEWAMYRDLGFIRIFGRGGVRTRAEGGRAAGATPTTTTGAAEEVSSRPGAVEPPRAADATSAEHRYAYLIYPHKPILAFEPSTRRLLSEYCVEFPDLTDAVTGSRLPDSDDVLAKWMALTGDERRVLRDANMHLPGRQLDPGRVRRDLWRLEEWERRWRRSAQAQRR